MKKILTLIFISLFSFIFSQSNRVWGTYFGSTGDDANIAGFNPCSIVSDAAGNIYMAGTTTSTAGIAIGGFQTTHGGGTYDAYVVKFDQNGNRIWCTYVGGNFYDYGFAIAVDNSGLLYVTGATASSVGIAAGGYQNTFSAAPGSYNAFLIQLIASNGFRVWSTYYGSSSGDTQAFGVATDGSGNVYMSGSTTCSTGIAIGGYQNSIGGAKDAFLVKFNSSGARLWGTYLGGSGDEQGRGVACDGMGNAYLTGTTSSSSGVASGGFQNTYGGGAKDGMFAKFSASGSLIWSTYYGGSSGDEAVGVCIEPGGNYVYLSGNTQSTSGIAFGGAQNTLGGSGDMFLVKFDNACNRIWGTYNGFGAGENTWYNPAIDPIGNIYLTGESGFSSSVTYTCGFQPNWGGGASEALLAKFSSSGALLCETYYGGSGTEEGYSVATDPNGYVYICGNTGTPTSTAIATPGAFQTTFGGGNYDAFIAKFSCQLPTQPGAITANTIACSGVSSNYSIAAVPGATAYTWGYPSSWSGPTLSSNFNSLTTGTISGLVTVAAKNGCGTSAPQTISITVSNPSLSLTAYSVTCNGACNGSITPIATGGFGPYTYTPSVLTNLCSGTQFVTMKDAVGCTVNKSIFIFQPTLLNGTVSPASPTICAGNSTSLSISSSGGTAPYTYSWSTSATTQSVLVSPTITTVYSTTITDFNNCNTIKQRTVTVNSLPIVTANTSSVTVCAGSTSCLFGAGATTYTWAGPCGFYSTSQNPCFPFASFCQCTYTLWGTDVNGCTNTSTVCINVNPNPTVSIMATNTVICIGQTSTLTSNGALTYSWSTSASGSVIAVSPTINTTYSVTGFDVNGCSNSTSITQSVSACTDLNESTLSDVGVYPNPTEGEFTIALSTLIENTSFEIYNSMGQLIKQELIFNLTTKLNLEKESNGIYFVRILKGRNSVHYTKIIKQ